MTIFQIPLLEKALKGMAITINPGTINWAMFQRVYEKDIEYNLRCEISDIMPFIQKRRNNSSDS